MIYEYQCISCNKITDEKRVMDDRLIEGICPDCGSATHYKFSVQVFTGSGEGWCGKMSNKGKSKVSLYNEKDGHRNGYA
jgi:putative FmdB family regulatory protein